jgi:hypothetical protein
LSKDGLKLSGPILVFATGEWKSIYQMAIVTSNAKKNIAFYTFSGDLTDNVSPPNIGDIYDLKI